MRLQWKHVQKNSAKSSDYSCLITLSIRYITAANVKLKIHTIRVLSTFIAYSVEEVPLRGHKYCTKYPRRMRALKMPVHRLANGTWRACVCRVLLCACNVFISLTQQYTVLIIYGICNIYIYRIQHSAWHSPRSPAPKMSIIPRAQAHIARLLHYYSIQ